MPVERGPVASARGRTLRAFHDVLFTASRRKRQLERERTRGKTEVVVRLHSRWPRSWRGSLNDEALVEGRRCDPRRLAGRDDKRYAIDDQRPCPPRKVVYGTHSAYLANALPGRRHLERAHQDIQARSQR